MAAEKKNIKKKKKGSRTLAIAFYTVYVVMIAAILGALFLADRAFESWLLDYEASQPGVKRDEIFQANFSDPDWEALYAAIGLSDTDFEGSEAFVSYMEAKVTDKGLHWEEAFGDFSDGLRYLVKAGDETIGYFTMVDHAPEDTLLADWQLDQVVLLYAYNESITIRKPEGVTVYVNGMALTDDHTIRVTTTKADDFLPLGVHSPRTHTQYLEGLMVTPEITAVDAEGTELEVTYDDASGIYTVLTEAPPAITEAEQKLAQGAVRAYALGMIGQINPEELNQYFDPIPAIFEKAPWMAADTVSSFRWSDPQVTDFCRYGENLFSVRGRLELTATGLDEVPQEFKVDLSFIFEKQGESTKCIRITPENIREEINLVRLRFLVGNTLVYTNLFEEDTAQLVVPVISAPEGQVFTGWFRRGTGEDGSTAYTLVFGPEQGIISLPEGSRLEPMVLYAGFENTAENGGNE